MIYVYIYMYKSRTIVEIDCSSFYTEGPQNMTHYPLSHNHTHTLRPPPALPSTLTPRHGQRRRHWELQKKMENEWECFRTPGAEGMMKNYTAKVSPSMIIRENLGKYSHRIIVIVWFGWWEYQRPSGWPFKMRNCHFSLTIWTTTFVWRARDGRMTTPQSQIHGSHCFFFCGILTVRCFHPGKKGVHMHTNLCMPICLVMSCRPSKT